MNAAARRAATAQEPGRLERSALAGVLVREIINFSSYWRSTTFSSTVEPTIYLLAFGFGFGSLVSTVARLRLRASSSAPGRSPPRCCSRASFPAMFGTFIKYKFQRTYDAILAAPVDTEELVTGEALWIAMRAAVYGCVPMLVAMCFGLDPSWGMLLVPFINFDRGLRLGVLGICDRRAPSRAIENFNYVTSAVITPLFLVAGTFFPISQLPEWAQVLAHVQPALPLRQLVRDAVFVTGSARSTSCTSPSSSGSALLMWRVAVWRMERRLID